MTDAGLYGDRLAKLFPRSASRARAWSSRCKKERSPRRGWHIPDRSAIRRCRPLRTRPSHFAFGCSISEPSRGWTVDTAPKGALKDETSIYDLRCETVVHFRDPFDFIYLYLPHGTLNDLANQLELGRVEYDVAAGANFLDPVMAHLGHCLLPMLERPHEANELFVGHVAMALNTHFLNKYAVGRPRVRSYRSGLAPWQLRTAKALIRANLHGEIPLARIASECGVSAAHFARAFRVSTGTPPHRWLMNQRIEQSKVLLADSPLSLTEIAIKCGFADQSHFTRVFSAATGATPGRWRLVRKG